MPKKNPYETQNTVEIPSFIGQSAKSEPVTEERKLVSEMVKDIEEEQKVEAIKEEPVKPARKKKKRLNVALFMSFFAVAFAILSIILLISNVNKSNELKLKTDEYESYVKTAETQKAAYEAEIARLNSELESYKKPAVDNGTGDNANGSRYYVEASYGVRIRKGPGVSYDPYDNLSALSSALQQVIDDQGSSLFVNQGSTITVYETKANGDDIWGRIGDGAWIAIRYQGEDFCTPSK